MSGVEIQSRTRIVELRAQRCIAYLVPLRDLAESLLYFGIAIPIVTNASLSR